MTIDWHAECAAGRATLAFRTLERDCTVAIERRTDAGALWSAFREVWGGTTDATNLMLFGGIVDDALEAAKGGRHADE